MCVLAIDIGATSGRAIIVTKSDDHFQLNEVHRFKNKNILTANYLTWDTKYLFDEILTGIKKALEIQPDISSLSIDTWAVDYVLLYPDLTCTEARAYRDMHTYQKRAELLTKLSFSEIYTETGIQDLHFNTIYQLYKDERIKKGAKVLLIPDFFNYLLTSKVRVELTNLSTTALYNPVKREVSNALLKKAKIYEDILPNIIYPGEEVGFIKDEYDVTRLKVISCCSHDTASAFLGSNLDSDTIFLSSGTWSLIGVEIDEPIIDESSMQYSFTNEVGYDHKIRFLKNVMGMFLLNKLVEEYQKEGLNIKYADIGNTISKSEKTNSIIDVDSPDFENPSKVKETINDYLKRTGQKTCLTPGEFFRVIYLSMALKYKIVIEQIEKLAKKKYKFLLIVGGGSQAEYLNSLIHEMTGLKILIGDKEATVLGNALVQFSANGEIKEIQKARKKLQRQEITHYAFSEELDYEKLSNRLTELKRRRT